MKLKLLLATILTTFSFTANAELLGIEVGTGLWDHEASGKFQAIIGSVGDVVDLDSDFGLKDDEEGYTYAIIRHAIPLVPNIKVMTTALAHKGTNPSFNLDFEGNSYNSAVSTELVLDHTDITAFWNLLDTGLTFDLGLTARQLDGMASVDDSQGANTFGKTTAEIEGTIPMLYAGISFSPVESLRFSFEANYIGSGDSAFTDTIAKVSYHTDFMLGIEAGVRTMTIELDDLDGNFSDMEFSGSFVGVSLKF